MAKRFPLEIIIGATDRASATLRRLTDRVDRFYQPFGRLRQALGQFAGRTGLAAVGSTLRDIGAEAWAVTRRMALGFATATAALGAFTYRLAMSADDVGDQAARLNVSTKALQAWTYGFNQADVAPEALSSALDTLNKNLGLAQIGMGKALPLFRGLGIDPRRFKTIDQLLPVLANRLSRISDPAKRAAIAQKLLGDAGQQMALKLAEGPKALEEMMRAALKAGAVIDDSVVESAGVLDSRLKALRGTLAGVAGNALGRLYPALIKIAEAIQQAIVKYQPQIEAFAAQFANNLPRYIRNTRDALVSLWKALEPVVKLVSFLFEKIGVGNTILAAFAVLIGGKLIASLVSLGLVLTELGVSLTVAFGAPALIVAALVAVVAAVWWVYKNWDTVSAKIGDGIDWVVEKFRSAWAWIKEAGAAAFDYIAEKLKYNPLFLVLRGMNFVAQRIAGSTASAPAAAGAPAVGGTLLQSGPRQQVDVNVNLSNLPPGTRTSTRASDGVRVDLSRGYAMPGVR